MSLQKYRADKATIQPDSATLWASIWQFGPTLAKIKEHSVPPHLRLRNPPDERKKHHRRSSMDVCSENHGSIFLVYPVSEAAQEWTAAHIPDDAQWFGSAFATAYILLMIV